MDGSVSAVFPLTKEFGKGSDPRSESSQSTPVFPPRHLMDFHTDFDSFPTVHPDFDDGGDEYYCPTHVVDGVLSPALARQ